jgi:gliding motility-associated-like protein
VTAGGATPPYQFQVNNGPFQNTGTFTGLSAGQYQITAQDATGCENSLVVTLNEPSALQAFLPTTIPLCSGDSVLLNANVNGGVSGYTYQWSNGATVHPLTVSVSQTTPLTLEVIDGNGCSTTASVLLELIPCGNIVYTIPNVFSPNGDGTNDQYGIFSENVIRQEAVIVNRWGEVMLELNQVNQLWDGLLPNGEAAKEGVYFMKFRLLGLGGEEKQGHVFFHLVR